MFACKCLIAKDTEYDDTLGKDHLFKIKRQLYILMHKTPFILFERGNYYV